MHFCSFYTKQNSFNTQKSLLLIFSGMFATSHKNFFVKLVLKFWELTILPLVIQEESIVSSIRSLPLPLMNRILIYTKQLPIVGMHFNSSHRHVLFSIKKEWMEFSDNKFSGISGKRIIVLSFIFRFSWFKLNVMNFVL